MHKEYPQLPSHLERKKLQFRYHHYMNLAIRAQKKGDRAAFDHFYQLSEYYQKLANGLKASPPAVPAQFPSFAEGLAQTFRQAPPEADRQWLRPKSWDLQNRRHISCNTIH